MTLALIAAVARNGAIGHNNQLLWHLPADLQFFRRTTQGCPVIMGRKTWDSLPKKFRPLPGRRNVVVTRNPTWSSPGAEHADSLATALTLAATPPLCATSPNKVFVIGGGQLYAAALPHADELVLTEVDQVVEHADTFFPPWSAAEFVEVQRETHPAEADDRPGWSWVTYQRRR